MSDTLYKFYPIAEVDLDKLNVKLFHIKFKDNDEAFFTNVFTMNYMALELLQLKFPVKS